MQSRKVSIILLTWNGLEYSKQCIESVLARTKSDSYEIIVVDNGSTDGTVQYLESLDTITLIKNNENLGFTKGNNVGIRTTVDTDIILLNNDMIIIQDDWIDRLQQTAYRRSDTGIVGCRLINEKGTLLHAGAYIYADTFWGQQYGGGEGDVNQYNSENEVEAIVFACAYIKREVIEKVGLLDEDFFAYFEDTDYCLRAKERGYRTVCSGDVTLIHYQNISTDENKKSFSSLFRKSQKTFKDKWKDSLAAKYKSRLAWHSIVNFPSGYAVSAKNIMLALDRKSVDVRYRYVYGQGTPFPVKEPDMSDNYIINIIKRRRFERDCAQVVYGQGDVFFKNNGAYKIGFTMLEVTGIPKTWVDNANRMDEVWVPSQFNVTTFKDSGVRVPLHVIPLGVDPNYFNAQITSYKKLEEFVFLSVFEWGGRKTPEKLLRAFCGTFRKNDPVVLLCKVINNDGGVDVPREIRKLNLPAGHPDIVFLYNQQAYGHSDDVVFVYNREIPAYEMGALYRSTDCFVLPTRGEGWGMPILEAMACGLPVIATNWSAQTEFMNQRNAYLLNVKQLVDAKAKCPYYEGFQWAEPDEEHLMYLMKHVYEHREEAKQKGVFASQEVLSKWTWDHTAEKILERINSAVGPPQR